MLKTQLFFTLYFAIDAAFSVLDTNFLTQLMQSWSGNEAYIDAKKLM